MPTASAARRRLLGPHRPPDRPARSAHQLLHRPALSRITASRESMINPMASSLLQYYPLRQPVAFAVLFDPDYAQQLRPGRRPSSITSSPSATSSACATPTAAAPTSIRSPSRAPTCPAFPWATISPRTARTLSETHSFGATMVNSLRAAYFRHSFLFDKRLNRTSPARARLQLRHDPRRRTGPAVLHRQRLCESSATRSPVPATPHRTPSKSTTVSRASPARTA